MYSDGVKVSKISEDLSVSQYIVKQAVLRMLQRGSMCDRRRSGRNPRLTKRDVRLIKYQAMHGLYCSANTMAADVLRTYGLHISGRHTQRLLRRYGFHRYADRAAAPVTKSWRRARREFYRTNLDTNWNHVVFTDEKIFNLQSNGRIKYYARSFEEYQEKHHRLPLKNTASVKVWGAITSNGVGPLICVSRHMNCDDYVREVLVPTIGNHGLRARLLGLREHTVPDFLWQQDNASFHKAPAAQRFFVNRNVRVMKWPPNSPDLSPIENIWNMLQYKLRVHQTTTGTIFNNETLFEAITQAWNSISREECCSLIESMPERLNELFRRNYNLIDY